MRVVGLMTGAYVFSVAWRIASLATAAGLASASSTGNAAAHVLDHRWLLLLLLFLLLMVILFLRVEASPNLVVIMSLHFKFVIIDYKRFMSHI